MKLGIEARKGSQKWIQKLVNDKPEILNSRIKSALVLPGEENIEWLSPLKRFGYTEYRDQAFLNALNIKLDKFSLVQFWPKRGPRWDGLGRSSSGKLFLVEAKSHIPELFSSMSTKSEKSARKIHDSLEATQTYLGVDTNVDWSQYFYQYANRIAHLYLLRKNDFQGYLVNVFFLNDAEMNGPTTAAEWKNAKKILHAYLVLEKHEMQDFITDVYVDVNELQ